MALIQAKSKRAENPIKLRDKVEVFSTEKDPWHVTGSMFRVHPEIAKKLIERGLAAETEAQAKASKKTKE